MAPPAPRENTAANDGGDPENGVCMTEPRRKRPPLPVRLLVLTAVLSIIFLAAAGANSTCKGWKPPPLRSPGGNRFPLAATYKHLSRPPPPPPPPRRIVEPERTWPKLGGLFSAIRGGVAQERRQLGGGGGAGRRQPRVLECFQAAQPVLRQTPGAVEAGLVEPAAEPCTMVLMDHVFAWSYGRPFVADYVPPSCDFNRVVMNLSVVSAGRQFDRLAIMYLNDTEVWRTSTAEPTEAPGIHWEYHKDMTPYLSLWKRPQRLIFDLGNLIDDRYTGSFNTTLTASFLTSRVKTDTAPPADAIIPISGRNATGGSEVPVSVFILPEHAATVTIAAFPRNANRAVLSISANGQGVGEEFWWANVLETDRLTFNRTMGPASGFGPFREVQARIDGRLAGVQWPFPVIFTGGVVPNLHRPIVGLQAFDLREHEIDISPWLPLLCDGNPHTFSFHIAGLQGDSGANGELTNKVSSSWYVTGKVFVWLDDAGSVTTGTVPIVDEPGPSIHLGRMLARDLQGDNQTLDYSVGVRRELTVSATVVTQRSSGAVIWKQSLAYQNVNNLTSYGTSQLTDFSIRGSDSASRGGAGRPTYAADYSYPLRVTQAVRTGAGEAMAVRANMYQGLALQVSGAAAFPDGLEAFSRQKGRFAASSLSTYRQGTASYQRSIDGRSTTHAGSMHQEFSFGGNFARYAPDAFQRPDEMLYYRNVSAANDAVVSDKETYAAARLDAGSGAGGAQAPAQVLILPPATQGSVVVGGAQE